MSLTGRTAASTSRSHPIQPHPPIPSHPQWIRGGISWPRRRGSVRTAACCSVRVRGVMCWDSLGRWVPGSLGVFAADSKAQVQVRSRCRPKSCPGRLTAPFQFPSLTRLPSPAVAASSAARTPAHTPTPIERHTPTHLLTHLPDSTAATDPRCTAIRTGVTIRPPLRPATT